MNDISRIAPITDTEAARLVSPGTRADLAGQIMSASRVAAVPSTAPPRRRPARRRWLIGIAAAAAAAVAALVATSLASPGQQIGPVSIGPPRAQALSFTRQGGYLDVVVTNPLAAPATYRAEFAAHHLNMTLNLVPVSPSLVGTLVYMGDGGPGITTITSQGRCWTGGGGSACPVGVRIPLNFHGSASFTFGRAARPGEQYESTGLVTAPGEVMHGLNYRGRTVPAVLAMLRTRHVSVPQYRYQSATGTPCGSMPPHPIPATWRVYDADPWAPQQVLLWVGPPAGAPTPHCASSGNHAPSPVASPTGSPS
jgi:hypothetical protein